MNLEVKIKAAGYGKKTVINNICFTAPRGTVTAVIGRNGCGKSTLIHAVAGVTDYKGKIAFDGVDTASLSPKKRASVISAIFQHPRRPHITVRELVLLGRNPKRRALSPYCDRDSAKVEECLERACLTEIADCTLDKISGGELKRAYFGMILAQDADVVLLDEATAFMDVDNENEFLHMIKKLAACDKKTVVSVMHSLELAVRYADNVLLLDSGRQLFFGKTEELLDTELIEKTFGVSRIVADGNIFFISE